MTNVELSREIRRFFRRYAAARVNIPSTDGNLYELYVYSSICRAIQHAGASLQLHTSTPGEFRFRCSPGPPNNNFSFYSFTGSGGQIYQIRNGLEIEGHSHMRHESDISILRAKSATALPSGSHNDLVLTVECKCYSAASKLKAEVRKNLGMAQDWSHSAHPTKSGTRAVGCIHCGLGFTSTFVTNVGRRQRPDIQLYLRAYDLGPHFGVVPKSVGLQMFNRVISDMIANL